MIYKNGHDLLDQLLSFLKQNDGYTIFVPYIKNDKLLELLDQNEKCTQIIVRWLPMDLISGASDLEVYETCSNRGITLYRNPRLHLKVFLSNESCYMCSANISNRAMSTNDIENFNYELATIIEEIDLAAKVYFQQILMDCVLVTEEFVSSIRKQINQIEMAQPPEDFAWPTTDQFKDPFLLSALPMTSTVGSLLDIYLGRKGFSSEELNCAAHDLALYEIPMKLSREELLDMLQRSVNNHPFILALKEHIEHQPHQSLNYGGVVRWIQKNTTTVPTPLSWELKEKQLVNTLYEWICELDETYSWNRPNHSQVIYKKCFNY